MATGRLFVDRLSAALCSSWRFAGSARRSERLEDNSVIDVMLDPDGRMFIDQLGEGITRIGELRAGATEIIIGSLAHALKAEMDEASRLSPASFRLAVIGSSILFHGIGGKSGF